jgi:hypothetical protein
MTSESNPWLRHSSHPGPPPFAFENSLIDTEKKTQKKKKVRAGPGSARTDRQTQKTKTPKQQKKKKKKRSVLARAVPGNCPDNSPPIGSQALLITSR